jgi:hypothetical protein
MQLLYNCLMENEDKIPEKPEIDPYKSVEFEEFLKLIEDGAVESWSLVATALGVDPKTIYKWRQHPRAKEAIAKAIVEALKGMKRAGVDDWRMWREYMKILGIKDIVTLEGGLNIDAIIERVESNYDDFARKAKEQMVANDAPVQDKG